MSRPIKFRAWFTPKKKMYGVASLSWLGIEHTLRLLSDEHPHEVFASDVVLMQFTGLLDRHGKEIYEGDVLEETEEGSVRGTVSFQRGCYIVDYGKRGVYHVDDRLGYLPQIIGNRYEHPHLVQP